MLALSTAIASTPIRPRKAETKEQFITRLMQQMTIEEKIGQLNLPDAQEFTSGISEPAFSYQEISAGQCGGVFNISTRERMYEAQRLAVEKTRLGIPLIFGQDVIHGYKTFFPIPLAMSCSWDTTLINRCAQVAASEASADGINWMFGPMVDICHDARWGRCAEGAGEDPFLGSAIARARTEGYQRGIGNATGASACVKHFAMYGAAEAGRDYNTADMSRVRMMNEYLPPYKAALEAGAMSVMASFNVVDLVPASGNKWLLTDLLRRQWGFDGVTATDYNGISEMIGHGMGTFEEVCGLALNAGVDFDMSCRGFVRHLKVLLEKGTVTEQQIDAACRRILSMKYDLGLFDDAYKFFRVKNPKERIFTRDNRQTARQMAQESMVLLKNDGLLPLKKKGKIALIGPLANTGINLLGTWCPTSDTTKYHYPSLLEGLQKAVGNKAEIVYAKGSNVYYDAKIEKNGSFKDVIRDSRTDAEMLQEALEAAGQSDVIVAALGELAQMSGESASRADISIPDAQQDLLRRLVATGKPVVLLCFTGRPLTLKWEADNVPAILVTWHGGSEAADAVADVLFGDINPSGKLTMSFPQMVGQLPYTYAHYSTGRGVPDNKWFGKYTSCYIDVSNAMLYPFGYGLSYTTYSYSDISLSQNTLSPNGKITASVTVTNTGNRDGDEIVQLYIRDMVGTIVRPVKELKGFKRIHLKAGETQTVTFDIYEPLLRFYNADLEYASEPGEFEVMIGPNSEDVKHRRFTLTL